MNLNRDVIRDMSKYINHLVNKGFVTEDGTPLKCVHCESDNLQQVNECYGQYGIEEYQIQCKNCNNITGHWAYGNWQIQ